MFSENHIILDSQLQTKTDVLKVIAQRAEALNIVSNSHELYQALLQRESESCTGMQGGIAIPHAKSQSVTKPSLIYLSLAQSIEWESLDDQPIDTVFALLIPCENGDMTHLRMLSALATQLLDETFVKAIKKAKNTQDIVEMIDNIFKKEEDK